MLLYATRRVTVRPGRSTPADSVYWRLLQTGRRSDPELESVLTLLCTYINLSKIQQNLLCLEYIQWGPMSGQQKSGGGNT